MYTCVYTENRHRGNSGSRTEGIPRADTKSGTAWRGACVRRLAHAGARGGRRSRPLPLADADAYGVGSQGGCGARYTRPVTPIGPPTTFPSTTAAAVAAGYLVVCCPAAARDPQSTSTVENDLSCTRPAHTRPGHDRALLVRFSRRSLRLSCVSRRALRVSASRFYAGKVAVYYSTRESIGRRRWCCSSIRVRSLRVPSSVAARWKW